MPSILVIAVESQVAGQYDYGVYRVGEEPFIGLEKDDHAWVSADGWHRRLHVYLGDSPLTYTVISDEYGQTGGPDQDYRKGVATPEIASEDVYCDMLSLAMATVWPKEYAEYERALEAVLKYKRQHCVTLDRDTSGR